MVSDAIIAGIALIGIIAVFVGVDRLASQVGNGDITHPQQDGMLASLASRLNNFATKQTTLGSYALAIVFAAGFIAIGSGNFMGGNDGIAPILGVLLMLMLFLGSYFGVRNVGLGNAHGLAAGIGGASTGFLLIIAMQLMFGVMG